jgi:hypothetical protein
MGNARAGQQKNDKRFEQRNVCEQPELSCLGHETVETLYLYYQIIYYQIIDDLFSLNHGSLQENIMSESSRGNSRLSARNHKNCCREIRLEPAHRASDYNVVKNSKEFNYRLIGYLSDI